MLRSLRVLPSVLFALLVILAPSTPASSQSATLKTSSGQAAPLVVGYFLQGSIYAPAPYLVKNLISPDGKLLVDQINYSQGFVSGGHCTVADPHADLDYAFSADQSVDGRTDAPGQRFAGYLHQLAELKRRFPKLKLLISLEGRGADFANDALPEARQAFLDSCIDLFIKGNLAPGISVPGLFDGIDVDWEYPHQPDAENFAALLAGLRHGMDAVRPGLTLSIAVGPSPHMYEGTDMGSIARLVDQIGLMTYDFSGPWSHRTGLIAPLRGDDSFRGETVERSIASYEAAGVPAAKLLMGLPFYGYGWHSVEEQANGLFQEGQPIRGDRPYSYIQSLAPDSTVFRDELSRAPFLFDGDEFWTYEDPVSIAYKTEYGKAQNLGGFMIWELAGDAPDGILLRTVRQSVSESAKERPRASEEPPVPKIVTKPS